VSPETSKLCTCFLEITKFTLENEKSGQGTTRLPEFLEMLPILRISQDKSLTLNLYDIEDK
jgi:hypothetical protein